MFVFLCVAEVGRPIGSIAAFPAARAIDALQADLCQRSAHHLCTALAHVCERYYRRGCAVDLLRCQRSRRLTLAKKRLVGLGRSGRGAGVSLVNLLLGGQESGADDLAVDQLGTLSLRKHEPNDGKGLDGVVPGNVVEDDVGEGLEESEHAENDPVGEPLNVILGLGALESLEREVGGDEETDEVGQEAGGDVEEDELYVAKRTSETIRRGWLRCQHGLQYFTDCNVMSFFVQTLRATSRANKQRLRFDRTAERIRAAIAKVDSERVAESTVKKSFVLAAPESRWGLLTRVKIPKAPRAA